MFIRFVSSSVLAVFLGLAGPVLADVVIYDNMAGGAAGISTALRSDDDGTSDGTSGFRFADDVTLSSTISITGVQWTGLYAAANTPPTSDVFSVVFFSDNAGSPSGNPAIAGFAVGNAVNRVDSGIDVGGFDVYNFSAAINFTMTGGTTYWISIYNNTIADSNDNFFWGTLVGAGNAYISGNRSATWSVAGGAPRMDFRLLAIPEPGALSLLGLTIFSMFHSRRRG